MQFHSVSLSLIKLLYQTFKFYLTDRQYPNFYLFINISIMLSRASSKIEKQGNIDILCIGEKDIGIKKFLKQYTNEFENHQYYQIFLKKIFLNENNKNDLPKHVFMHLLDEEDDTFIKKKFDAIILFVHYAELYKAEDTLITWMGLYEELSYSAIVRKPIHLIVTGAHKLHKYQQIQIKEKASEKLADLVRKEQISFWSNMKETEQELLYFFKKVFKNQIKDLFVHLSKQIIKKEFGSKVYVENVLYQLRPDYFKSQHHKYALTQLLIVKQLKKNKQSSVVNNIFDMLLNPGKTKKKPKMRKNVSIKLIN